MKARETLFFSGRFSVSVLALLFAILVNHESSPQCEAFGRVAHRFARAILHFRPLRDWSQTAPGGRDAMVRGRGSRPGLACVR